MENANISIIEMNEGAQAVRERPAIAKVDVFNFGDAEVRTVTKDGEAWFVANDVCAVLNIDRTQVRRLDEDEKGVYSIHTPGGKQDMNVVSEPGLYKLIFTSNKPEAKAFKRWVTHDVLPAIRKQGFYSMLTDEKLLEVAFDRCLHNEDHQTLEFNLFRMQDELTMKRWEAMENVIWPKRFDHKSSKEAQKEIEDLWGADVDGAMAAKEVWSKNICSRYGMSRIYGKWSGPKNPLAYRKRNVNYDKIIEFEIQSAKSRFCMGLPDHDPMVLRRKIAQQEEKVEQIKEIIARTDKHLAKYDYDKKGEPVESIEEGLRKEKLWSDTFAFGHRELKEFLGM